ncbi:hypothetical protein H6G64_10350 [Calothrix sp. FACHB-156]|nr:hypothetical protein [Calothrix sp. FACHB-156]
MMALVNLIGKTLFHPVPLTGGLVFTQSPGANRALRKFLEKMDATKRVYQSSFHLAKLYSKEG